MQIYQRPLSDIKPYEKNPSQKKHNITKGNAQSIKDFGFQQPIVVDRAGVQSLLDIEDILASQDH
jgi:ParB-like chromosome segregation protein Spo0J